MGVSTIGSNDDIQKNKNCKDDGKNYKKKFKTEVHNTFSINIKKFVLDLQILERKRFL